MGNSRLQRLETEIAELTESELNSLISLCRDELHRRALASGDIEALVAEAFAEGFDSKGNALEPWVSQGLIVACGSKVNRTPSGSSHLCRFISVKHVGSLDSYWVWEDEVSDLRLAHEPQHLLNNGGTKWVTILVPEEGLELDFVHSKGSKAGLGGTSPHRMVSATSWVVTDKGLEKVRSRKARPPSQGGM